MCGKSDYTSGCAYNTKSSLFCAKKEVAGSYLQLLSALTSDDTAKTH
jgi:hypothetical protein